MTDLTQLPAPEAIHDGPLAGTHRFTFAVVDAEALSPGVRRLRLTAPGLDRLRPDPGQDLMMAVPTGPADDGGIVPTINRRYSIRAIEQGEAGIRVVVDVVLHGDGPGSRWAADAAPGDRIVAVGPRGKVVPVPDAAAHLFVADASGTPATLSMLESLPVGAGHAVLVVDGPDDLQPTSASDDSLTWLVGASGAEIGEALTTAVRPGVQVYLAGERTQVAGWRDVLQAAGVPDEQVRWKAYWSRSAANAAHGEPAREG